MDNIQSLRFFMPECVLTVATIAMLIQDLIVRRSARRVPSLVAGALFWLALAAVATELTPSGVTPLFGGLLQHDPMRIFFAWLFLAAAAPAVVPGVRFVRGGVGSELPRVPFPMWAPDVSGGAPPPSPAFLSVGPKAAGFAVAIRFFFAAFEKQLPGGGYEAATDLPWPAI